MDEQKFAELPTIGKWNHLKKTMDYIVQMDAHYTSSKIGFDMRRRLNPHHAQEQADEETTLFNKGQRSLRVDQYQRWAHVKVLYSTHRDELTANTFENPGFEECKSILERIFTMEVDDALRDILGE